MTLKLSPICKALVLKPVIITVISSPFNLVCWACRQRVAYLNNLTVTEQHHSFGDMFLGTWWMRVQYSLSFNSVFVGCPLLREISDLLSLASSKFMFDFPYLFIFITLDIYKQLMTQAVDIFGQQMQMSRECSPCIGIQQQCFSQLSDLTDVQQWKECSTLLPPSLCFYLQWQTKKIRFNN